MTKQNSKSRSFAENQAKTIKLFGNSFGKGSHGKKHNNSFLSVNNQNQMDMHNKLSARSGGSAGRGVRLFAPHAEPLSQVSESHSFISTFDHGGNEVDQELIELMKQS